jgi:hypothetical protein
VIVYVEAHSGELINRRPIGADHAGQGNNFASKCVEAAAVYRIAPYEEREKFCLLLLLQQKLSV